MNRDPWTNLPMPGSPWPFLVALVLYVILAIRYVGWLEAHGL